MQESKFTQKLLKALRSHPRLHSAVIFKHNDRSTRGIPDFSISIGVRTLWFEVKVGKNNPTKIQAYFLKKLSTGAVLLRNSGAITWFTDNEYFEFAELVEIIVRRCINA